MADKKKFEKPQMETIKLNNEVRILTGSDCLSDCSTDYCSTNTAG